jgi:hypothetical protein
MLEFILIAIIILQAILHFVERRDMYNRLMCRNLHEYKQGTTTPPKKNIPSAHDRVLKNWRDRAGDK